MVTALPSFLYKLATFLAAALVRNRKMNLLILEFVICLLISPILCEKEEGECAVRIQEKSHGNGSSVYKVDFEDVFKEVFPNMILDLVDLNTDNKTVQQFMRMTLMDLIKISMKSLTVMVTKEEVPNTAPFIAQINGTIAKGAENSTESQPWYRKVTDFFG